MKQKSALITFLEQHGYEIINPENIAIKDQNIKPLSFIISQGVSTEDVFKLPEKYIDLYNFISNLPEFERIQLKPFLFAFYFHSICKMLYTEITQKQEESKKSIIMKFYDDFKDSHHSFHTNSITSLKKIFNSPNPRAFKTFFESKYSANITEIAFNSLISYLSDKLYFTFLSIIEKNIIISFLPYEQAVSRPEIIPEFILNSNESTNQVQTKPLIELLENSITNLSNKLLEKKLIYFDQEQNFIQNSIILPEIKSDRILYNAINIQQMAQLSKSELPSCAYITFPNDDDYYDINLDGTLIAVVTKKKLC